MTPEQLLAKRDKLHTAIEALEAIDGDHPALDGLYDLINEVFRQIEAYHSEGARRAAEARLAYHLEHDTLDLY